MRKLVLWLLASLGLFLTACVEASVPPPAPACQVTHVVDGDTLHLTCGGMLHKVRLLGYDTPEIYHPLCPAERRAGLEATDRLRAFVATGPVTGVQFADHDRYGRDLASVQIAGSDIASHMLASGLALPYAGHRHPDWCARLGG